MQRNGLIEFTKDEKNFLQTLSKVCDHNAQYTCFNCPLYEYCVELGMGTVSTFVDELLELEEP